MASVGSNNIVVAIFAPGVVTKNVSMDLPAIYPEMMEIISGYTITTANASPMTWAGQALAAEVYESGSPTATGIPRIDGNSLKIGNTTAAYTLLIVVYRAY